MVDCRYIKKSVGFHGETSHVKGISNRPAFGWVKLNIDGAFDPSSGKGCLGFCLRYRNGRCLLKGCKPNEEMNNCSNEALAIKEGIIHAGREGVSNLEIESDNLSLVKILNKGNSPPRFIRNLFSNIFDYMSYFQNVKISHNLKDGNRVTHSLTVHAKNLG